MNYTLNDIKSWIGNNYFSRGLDYQSRDLVQSVNFVDDKLLGIVVGSKKYEQVISFTNNANSG